MVQTRLTFDTRSVAVPRSRAVYRGWKQVHRWDALAGLSTHTAYVEAAPGP